MADQLDAVLPEAEHIRRNVNAADAVVDEPSVLVLRRKPPSVHENREALRGLEAQEDGIGRNDRHAEGKFIFSTPSGLVYSCPLCFSAYHG